MLEMDFRNFHFTTFFRSNQGGNYSKSVNQEKNLGKKIGQEI